QRLGDADTGHAGFDGSKWTAVLGRCFRLGVVGLQLAGAAVEPQEDAGGAAVVGGAPRAEAEQGRQRQPHQAQETGLERAAATYPLAVTARCTLVDPKHGILLAGGGGNAEGQWRRGRPTVPKLTSFAAKARPTYSEFILDEK